MAYTTTLDVVRKTGLGVEIQGEHLGKGDGTKDSYDLAKGHVIDSSYTIEYGDPNSNSLTPLTVTTDFTIDLDKGAIVLTSAGKSATSGKEIYASYIHSPKLSDTLLATYIDAADDEVDEATGTIWDGPTAKTEYFDGRRGHEYPATDRPFARDYDEPASVQLSQHNVTEITAAYFLQRGVGLSNVQSYDLSGTSYTDNTDEANSAAGTGFAPFASITAVNDILYIGSAYKFLGIQSRLFTLGVTATNNTIEYWNGTAWTAFTPTSTSYQAVLDFESTGDITWDDLSAWTTVSVNSSTAYYFVRIVSGGTYSTEPVMSYIGMNQDLVINRQIALNRLVWNEDGNVTFLNEQFDNGVRNIRIDYKRGKATTPELINELSAMYCGLRAYANITGGSYDDATSFTVGRKAVSIGEVYVNVREVVNQFRARIDEILRRVGTNYGIAVA